MTAYYNENDPYAAQWLRNLITAGHIAPGDVDERSIVDVHADDLRGYTQCHFFAGIGGWSFALRLAGWSDDRPVWTGSCPCQPFSGIGKHGKAFDDERHLWPVWRDLISHFRPANVFGEQVAGGDGLEWLSRVRADLEASGYAVGAANLAAGLVAAPHKRERLWFAAVGDAESIRWRESWQPVAQTKGGRQTAGQSPWANESSLGTDGRRRRAVPGTPVLAHGIPARISKLRAIGNAIVPQVAATFIEATMI
ncbi:MAG: DNA cytosine methyltransferase [Hyphomicrobium sp.]|uniref:DNA cytosine methyltransferase n=1 Tax=Hyphomicrobium sp. TaxID=82 RepID=UPI0035666074